MLGASRLWVEHGRGGELAAGGDPELAVDVARMGTDRLDANVQSEGYLRVGVAQLEQRQHFALAPAQSAYAGN